MEFRADLHCHSTCSDGDLSPAALIDLAKASGLSGLSITDHDTVEAYTEALFAQAEKEGICLKTGVELSTQCQGVNVHILGYGFDVRHAGLRALCAEHTGRRLERNRRIVAKLRERGMEIDEADFTGQGTIGRPHIALALCKKGYVATIAEAFDKYLGDDRCCYDPGVPFLCPETIEVIHQAGGKAFLAHPHFLRKAAVVEALLTYGFDGIECYYGRLSRSEEEKWLKVARQRRLLISGGSDFHGEGRERGITLGCSWVGKEEFDLI